MKNTDKNLKYIIFVGLLLAGVVGIVALSGCIDKCGDLDQNCCEKDKCNSGDLVCGDNKCVHCGSVYESCCKNNKCDKGICSEGKCEKCGKVGELCCSGDVCDNGVCSNGKCTAKTTEQTPLPKPPDTLPVKLIKRECESVDDYSVGDPNNIFRTGASNGKVLGQFGCEGKSPYNSKSGYAKYNVQISDTGNWSIDIRYSCNNAHSVPIEIYIDDEQKPRAKFYPENTHNWNSFKDTGKIIVKMLTFDTNTELVRIKLKHQKLIF